MKWFHDCRTDSCQLWPLSRAVWFFLHRAREPTALNPLLMTSDENPLQRSSIAPQQFCDPGWNLRHSHRAYPPKPARIGG